VNYLSSFSNEVKRAFRRGAFCIRSLYVFLARCSPITILLAQRLLSLHLPGLFFRLHFPVPTFYHLSPRALRRCFLFCFFYFPCTPRNHSFWSQIPQILFPLNVLDAHCVFVAAIYLSLSFILLRIVPLFSLQKFSKRPFLPGLGPRVLPNLCLTVSRFLG